MGPFRLKPVYQERPWGGTRLKNSLQKSPPEKLRVGESWELSDHPDGRSLVDSGPYAGYEFSQLLKECPEEITGQRTAPDRYPVLIKFLDAAKSLSIQVHPDDEWCVKNQHPDRGKSECWYVLDCAPGAEIILGLKPEMNLHKLKEALDSGTVEKSVSRKQIHPGCFISIPAGTIHAILAGTLICEIQQASNTTFRIWDWNRQPRRELHIEQALSCANAAFVTDDAIQETGLFSPGAYQLVKNDSFEVTLLILAPGDEMKLPPNALGNGTSLICVEGDGQLDDRGELLAIHRGEYVFVPANCENDIIVKAGESGLRLLMTRTLEFRS